MGLCNRRASQHKPALWLHSLAAALPGTLELFEADLTIDGSFDEAVKGSHYVFHVASPVPSPKHTDPDRDLVQPAVRGTISVLKAAARSRATVQRVVLTSSGTAVTCDRMRTPPANGTGYTETDWVPAETLAAYPRSKVQAERAAWDLAKQESLDLVTILPVLTLGPVISTASTWSVDFMRVWLEGGAGNPYPFIVDIRDVVDAHIRAAELPAASGRYILSHPTSLDWRQAVGWLQECFPQHEYADVRCMSDDRVLDSSKAARELGIRLRPMRERQYLTWQGACISCALPRQS